MLCIVLHRGMAMALRWLWLRPIYQAMNCGSSPGKARTAPVLILTATILCNSHQLTTRLLTCLNCTRVLGTKQHATHLLRKMRLAHGLLRLLTILGWTLLMASSVGFYRLL